jgi:2,3-bisphosphoglycerate-independent phosphoglycerate mutase
MNQKTKKLILVILDGWGIANDKMVSAIDSAKTPVFDFLKENYASSKLEASGMAVGLPDGQMGNSEVGHMNIGAGRVVYQDLVKLNLEASQGGFDKHPILNQALEYARKGNHAIHLMGLVSDGGVHAHTNHLKALCTWAANQKWEKLFIHGFTDGRDTDPRSGLGFLREIESHCDKTAGKVVSLTGRYYSMDRDKRWERVKIAWDNLVTGKAEEFESLENGLQKSYDAGVTDEFLMPIRLKGSSEYSCIKPGDVVINFNFRTDRGREITEALSQQDFPDFGMHAMDLHYITMTRYDETFKNVAVLYEKDNLNNTLGEVISAAGLQQIRIAETEKYPHVTFFFNGGREEPFKGEKRLMCPSPKVATYDQQPEMSAKEITAAIIPEMQKGEASFICLNFANPDMVGHTGVFEAVVNACETVDKCLGDVYEAAKLNHYACLVIADHGNADFMRNPDGSPNTAHSTAKVPCIMAADGFEKVGGKKLTDGKLGDLAPSILSYLGLESPVEMNGNKIF